MQTPSRQPGVKILVPTNARPFSEEQVEKLSHESLLWSFVSRDVTAAKSGNHHRKLHHQLLSLAIALSQLRGNRDSLAPTGGALQAKTKPRGLHPYTRPPRTTVAPTRTRAGRLMPSSGWGKRPAGCGWTPTKRAVWRSAPSCRCPECTT